MYSRLVLAFLLLSLISCSSSYEIVPGLHDWKTPSLEEQSSFFKELGEVTNPPLLLRHRINLITPIEKRSFEQVFVAKDDLFSLSFFAPAYIKLLYRIVNGSEKDLLIDYQSKSIYELNTLNSISLGDEILLGIGRIYPEIMRGSISKQTLDELGNINKKIKNSLDKKSYYLEFKNSEYDIQYLLERGTGGRLCLRESYVTSGDHSMGVSYRAMEISVDSCIPTKIKIKMDSSSAYLESLLLIKQDKIQDSPDPFSTEIPAGFTLR